MKKYLGLIAFVALSITVFGQKKERPVQPDIPGDVMIDIGWNLFFEDPRILETRWWPSNSIGIYYQKTKKLNDHLTVNPSLGFSFEKMTFDLGMNYQVGFDKKYTWDTLRVDNLRKNKLHITYFELPVELRYYPIRTIDGEGLFIGIGGVFGGRIGANTKVKYRHEGSNRKEKLYGNFGLNDFRYGMIARVGIKPINGFVKFYFNEVWRRGPLGANPTMFTFGINFTGF